MMKSILLAGGMMIAAPVLAQTAPSTGQAAPATTTSAPATAVPQSTTTPQSATGTQAQAAPATPADTTTAQADAAADPAAAGATPSQSQVAQVVDQQFATYDKDGNGTLSKAEFAAWMTALKSSTPAAASETPAQKTAWNDAAFKQADGDKSATVTKTELTSFLVKGSQGAS